MSGVTVATDLDLGALLIPIKEHGDQLGLAELVASRQQLQRYLASKGFHFNISDILEQPTPLGLALVASLYAEKGDQYCPILIASTIPDFSIVVSRVANGTDGEKLVVIFQPTDNNSEETKNWVFTTHKTVVYLEKRKDTLHMYMNDSTPYKNIKRLCMLHADKILGAIPRVYYTQNDIMIDAEKTKPLVLQTDFWSCGTHAFRIARKIAKAKDFLSTVKIVKNEPDSTVSAAQINHIKFNMPEEFARFTDNKLAREKVMEEFSGSLPLARHFTQQNTEQYYIDKFTKKYIAMISIAVLSRSQEELIAMVEQGDVVNYTHKPVEQRDEQVKRARIV